MLSCTLRVIFVVALVLAASGLAAAPLAPDDLRVSDTASWLGQPAPAVGVSSHPAFSMIYRGSGTVHPAAKARFQVSVSSEFTTILWDSGFVAISATAPDQRTPNVNYAGPALSSGATYYIRGGTQDDQGASSPWSGNLGDGSVPSFNLTAATGACDVRVQTGAGNVQQGNPATLPAANVSFSAEFVGSSLPAHLAQVQVAYTASFSRLYWTSDWVSIGSVNAGQRCAAIAGSGDFESDVAYFWRIRFQDDEQISAWSAAGASFVVSPPDPAQSAPAGFAGSKRDFGVFGTVTSDIEVADINGDNVPDAVVVSSTLGECHAVYLSFGAATAGSALYFGSAAGGQARVTCLDYDMDGDQDIAVACGQEVILYANSGSGTFAAVVSLDAEASGELLSLASADMNWSGYPSLVATFTDRVIWFPNNESEFQAGVLVVAPSSPIVDVTIGDLVSDGQPEFVVLTQGTLEVLYVRNSFIISLGDWDFPDATQISVTAVDGIYPNEIICTNGEQLDLRAQNNAGSWYTQKTCALGHPGACADILLADVDNSGLIDAVLLLDTGTLICRQTSTDFVEHEFAGYAQEGAHTRGALCDADLDGRVDIAVIRPGASNQVYLNRSRRTVSIADGTAVQPAYGEGYIEFEVTLDAPPTSLIEIDCATVEEEGGEGDGDGISDASNAALMLSGPLPYVPTTTRLYFVLGQMRAVFRVGLTKALFASPYTMHVNVYAAHGAVPLQATATGTIYAPGSGSSGPAATSGMQRDWTLRGQVNAVAQTAGGNTYFGGEFDGVEWQAGGATTLDSYGNRLRALPNLSGTGVKICAAAMDADGSVYLGGHFALTVQSQLIKNIIKVKYDGSIDTSFHPNPDTGTGDGQVNAIALKAGSVYFGGRFTSLANCSAVFKNIAHVLCTGAYPACPDYYGVYHIPQWGEPTPQPAEVLALIVANSGLVGADYLIVGGKNFDRARSSASSTVIQVGNLALFKLGGYPIPNMPRVSGAVQALAVSDQTFSNYGLGGASRTILFGGNFEWVFFPRMPGSFGTPIPYETHRNLNSTNFSGELKYGKSSSSYSSTPVHALLIESGDHLWVGRNATDMGAYLDPLAYYTVSAGDFTRNTTFASGLNAPVRALALGDNQVLVTGEFSQRTTSSGTVPVGRALLFSTQTLGAVSNAFRSSFDQPIFAAASGRDAQDRLRGYIVGGMFTKLIAQRGNLAAMNAAGELLPWGPSVDGPVYALTTDGNNIYFGGSFSTATGTQVFNRRSLASAPANDDAINVNNWIADIAGSAVEVRALVLDGSSLVVGGDFTSINGSSREDAAAVSKTVASSPWIAAVTAWDPALAHDAASKVYALVLDSGNIYIGGNFSGTTGTTRPALLAVTAPSAGAISLLSWNAAIATPCTVRAIGVSSSDVFFVGQFSSVGSASRVNAAAVSKSSAAPTSFAPAISGNLYSLAALPTGTVYIGGETLTVTVSGTPTPRRGVASFDAAGVLLSWEGAVLSTSTGEVVRALLLDDTQAVGRLWVGGNFTGTAHTGQHDLTWFTRAWNITTPNLPNANEGQAYGPVQVTLSEALSCSWSINSPVSWLTINSSGQISGTCPVGGLAYFPVEVTATHAGSPTIVTSKWFLMTVTPLPPPTVVSMTATLQVTEGPGPLVEPAPLVTLSLNQLFSADVVLELQYIDDTAFDGFDYASQVVQATIVAGHWSVDVPLCIFGDTILGTPPQRQFKVRVVSHTQNVYVSATAGQCVVTIQDDDPPQSQHAIAHELHVCESSTQAADPAHVVAAQPVFKWAFRSDYVGDVQTGWQVQVFTNAAFSGTAFWDSGSQAGSANEIQLGSVGGSASFANGQDYFARVRVWSAPTVVSDWLPLAMHTNTPPPAAVLTGPSGTVILACPTLTWDVSTDAEGDALNYKVALTGPGGTTAEMDSSIQPYLFERYQASTGQWLPFGQSGASAGFTKARATIPLSLSLAQGSWDWTVEVSDGFESTAIAGGGHLTINVQPAYAVSGTVSNGTSADSGRTVSVYRMPGHTFVASNVTNSSGFYIIPLGGSPVPGEVLAVVIDNPASPPPGYVPAYAANFVRFSGNDLTQTSGPNKVVDLKHGHVIIDPRGLATVTLNDLVAGSAGDPDWSFSVNVDQLVLRAEMTDIDLDGTLAVLGTGAGPGEPTSLFLPASLNAQNLNVHTGAALLVQESATVDAHSLQNAGCVSLESGSSLKLRAASASSAQFVMQTGAALELDFADLTFTGGYPVLQGALIQGTSGNETITVQGGSLSAAGTSFSSVTLDVGAAGDVSDFSGATFDGPALDHRIGWSRQRGIEATLTNVRFELGATYNIAATSGADTLSLVGCGGDLAGESADLDPGEATSQDIVKWTVAQIADFRVVAGDNRVLLLWNTGTQTGAGFTYKVYAATSVGGSINLVGTTQDSFYVEGNLTNGVPRYYSVELVAWTTHSVWTAALEVTPDAPTLESAFPITLRQTGTAPGIAQGAVTHFKGSTAITSPDTGVSVPSSSIDVISETLVLFDVETNAASLGNVSLELTTADVWVEHGAPGYSETVSFQAEVKPPATPNYPSVVFVQTGGAVAPDALTDGAFSVAVEFNAEGGAEIEPQSFECVVDRDILIAGQTVAAGTNLAGPQYGLWGTPSATGATWQVDQIQVTTDPQEEFISRGELIVSVRVANAFGYVTPWNALRIHVQGGDPDYAITEGTIEPGKPNQMLIVRAGCLQNTSYDVVFPQGSGITVQSVTTNSNSGISLEVTVSATANSPIGSDSYDVVLVSTQQTVATGIYHTAYYYRNLYSSAGPGAGPRAVTGAVGVTLQTGEFTWGETDLVTKARKFPIVWSRTYRSDHMAHRDTPLGRGWYGAYFQKVEVGSNSLRWQAGNGDIIDFDNPQFKEGKFEWNCPPGYNILAKTSSDSFITDCDIRTSEGLTYRFSMGCLQFETLLLREIVDSNLNRQVLEYDNEDKRLLVIRGDTYDFTGNTPGHGVAECLRLTYYNTGLDLLKTVTRVRSVKDQTDSAPLDIIRYYYTLDERLALQRIPDGDRFSVRSYRGYFYDQDRLTKIFAPSRAVTNPTQITPASDDSDGDWNCVAVASGTPAPISALTIAYDSSGRVESQILGPAGGSEERRYTISYGSGATSNERTVTPPSGSACDVKYVLNDDGQATSVTQYVPAVTGPGSMVFTTTYEYEAYTQNLLKVTQPKGNCTYFSYAPGNAKTNGSGNFTSMGVPSGGTTTELAVQQPWTADPGWAGCVAKIFQVTPGGVRERYYVVAHGTTATTLVLGANLLCDGFVSGFPGTFKVYDVNGNPLSRSLLIQERRCEGSGWAASDLVTSYIRKDDKRNGDYYSNLTETIDPWGRQTTIDHRYRRDFAPASERSLETVLTSCDVATAKDAQADNTSRVLKPSYYCYDPFGNLYRIYGSEFDDPDENSECGVVAYHYFPVNRSVTPSQGAYPGQLSQTREGLQKKGTEATFDRETNYTYDTRGNVIKIRQPRGESPAPYAAADFDSTIVTNAAGQVIHVTKPGSGPAGSCRTSETWYFYDVDGRLVQQCVKFEPVDQAAATQSGDGTEQDESEILSAFPRPALITSGSEKYIGSGWIHTRYEYNNWGDLIKEKQDFDFDPNGNLMVSQTDYEYDLEGRQTVVNDPRARITKSQYEPRGLRSVTFASGTAEQSAVDYRYDNNGNLNWEMVGAAPGSTNLTTVHDYDGFNRCTQTAHHLGAGGVWSELVEYPQPSGPVETGTFLAVGAGSGLVKKRGSKSREDAAGRTYRNWTIAQNKSGGELKGAIDADGLHWAVSASELDARGLPVHSWIKLAGAFMPATEHNTFDGRGTLVKAFGPSTSEDGEHASYFYDAAGNTIKTITPVVGPDQLIASSIANVEYDPADQPIKTTLQWQGAQQTSPDEVSTTTTQRNNLGWPERTVDGAGRETRADYNLAGLVRRNIVFENGVKSVTEHEYYKDGTLKKETAYRDASGSPLAGIKQETTYEYDAKRRVIQTIRPGNAKWTYTYTLTDQVRTETRPDSTVVTNDYDLVGNLTQRSIVSPAGNSKENYTYGPFDEVTEAKTTNGGQLTSKLEMEYNSLGQVERQVLTVYDDSGNALSPYFIEHNWSKTQLGFASLYESSTLGYSSFEMKCDHDCFGRETQQEYWDKRKVKTEWSAVLPFRTIDNTHENDEIPLVQYFDYECSLLYGREFHRGTFPNVHHVRAMRPSQPGRAMALADNVKSATTLFAFGPQGGLVDVTHSHARYNPGNDVTYDSFAHVQTRYDAAGNPVLERSVHRGGLSRVMKYDHSTRLSKSFSGHLISSNTPGLILQPSDGNLNPAAAQWERTYTQDTLDNITGISDVIGADVASRTTTGTTIKVVSDTENLVKSINSSGDFDYDNCKSLEIDPTTGLTYKYNYRGQVTEVVTGGASAVTVRRCVYDCFGRMVLQLEAPGTDAERGTIFVPNVGFGGGGEGADLAAEITFERDGSAVRGREVVQYTYGIGAMGGGLGRKRLVEFVAYCSEFAPYYRFLHEDAQGNTIATTSLWGDRLDEYDYTDYGVPLHAPVALDGRWIAGIADGGTDLSTVTLTASDLLVPNELIGCELRVALKSATAARFVFLAGTVISHFGDHVIIRDPGHAIANMWGGGQVHKPSACFFDLREGCYRGVIGAATPGTWLGQSVTFLTVNDGPFETWMVSYSTPGPYVYVQLGSQSAKVIGADQPADSTNFPGNGFKRLILEGQGYSGAAAGEWYTIKGNCTSEEICRSGTWAGAPGCTGGLTTFVLEDCVELRDEQLGWWLQPNISCQAFFPIVNISKQNHTVTVQGDQRGLGQPGTRFRIDAPPGTETRGVHAGLLPKFAEAANSRNLYRGYRYETGAAGRWDGIAQGVAARQGGNNFTGQHYTLYRHYDPSLMRFTSLDPLASSSNLFAYCENNPHGAFDPDGLYAIGDWTRSGWKWVDETFFGDSGWATGVGRIAGGGADFFVSGLAIPVQHVTWAFTGEAPDNWKMWQSVESNTSKRWDYLSRADESTGKKVAAVSVGATTDLFGLTSLGEAYSRHDLTTGDALSDKEVNARWVTGGFALAMYVAPVVVKGFSWARARVPGGGGNSGPVVFRAPKGGASLAELAQIREYVAGCNEAMDAGALSRTGRVSTAGALREAASAAADVERARAAAAETPYRGQVGHVPDTTWTGRPNPHSWQDLTRRVNTSLGSQAAKYPRGYKPTKFVFEEPK